MNTTISKKTKSRRLQLAVHLTTALVASCVVAGMAFSYGIAASKQPVVQVNNSEDQKQQAFIKSGEMTGRLDATRAYDRGINLVYIENQLDASDRKFFWEGYDRGYDGKQKELAQAGLVYGSCLRANGISEDQVMTKVMEHLEVKVFQQDYDRTKYKVRQGVFADAVARSYHLGHKAQLFNDSIFLAQDGNSYECSLYTTALDISELDYSLRPLKFNLSKSADLWLSDNAVDTEVTALVANAQDDRLR